MNIAVLGGAFNPPHWGHLSIAKQVLDFCPIDQVWLMPTYQYNPQFNKQLISFDHRLAMVKYLERPKIKVSDFEKTVRGISHTYQIMRALKKKYHRLNFSFIIGSDNLAGFDKWHRYQDLLKTTKVLVFPRKNISIKIPYPNMELVKSPLLRTVPISSTHIREKIAENKNLEDLLPKEVAAYLKDHCLFD